MNTSSMAHKKILELFPLTHYRGLPGFFVTNYFCDMDSKPAMRMILSASDDNPVVVSGFKVPLTRNLETRALKFPKIPGRPPRPLTGCSAAFYNMYMAPKNAD